jgi:hypothetical protein
MFCAHHVSPIDLGSLPIGQQDAAGETVVWRQLYFSGYHCSVQIAIRSHYSAESIIMYVVSAAILTSSVHMCMVQTLHGRAAILVPGMIVPARSIICRLNN